ncbi:AAA family ATPase [Eubacterium sp. MSJ-13]|uniref:AAA family ATPase n=1 Tax=Eubacterium sp. MSJ-13 TaxID=2841513 RepID=UPI00209DCA4C|nr:AAA family ATPase [Eubacterium sp. MSJ-13]
MENKKEKTAPNVSVGADTEQPLPKNTTSSISEYEENIKSFEKMQREMQLSLDPSYLKTISMNELFDTQYGSKQPLIDGLLYPGTYIFAGSPKLGKSFLMAQLAYHVSTGTPLWNYTTRKGTVLYLALEDDYRRLQERLYRMFGTEVKQEEITDKTVQSIRAHGWLPDIFRQIIRGAKDILQEMIFKFKLPPKPVPKIDLQEWNDMWILMDKLQKQSQEMKQAQQEISSLKKQLSETKGFFKGKERKSLEGKIERAEKQEKRIHTDMEQNVKQAGYSDVQSFAKAYHKSEELIREYNKELREWKNQTAQKKEKTLEPPTKASVLKKLHSYQQEGKQQPKRTKKKSRDMER